MLNIDIEKDVPITDSVITSIHCVEPAHRIGRLRFGRVVGDPIVIPQNCAQTTVTLKETGMALSEHTWEWFDSRLKAIIKRQAPDTIIIGQTNSEFSYETVRTVKGVDINKDRLLKGKLFYKQ